MLSKRMQTAPNQPRTEIPSGRGSIELIKGAGGQVQRIGGRSRDLGVDPRKSDQMVRSAGAPHGPVRRCVAVFARGTNADAAHCRAPMWSASDLAESGNPAISTSTW